jgi:hypothetical protein
VWRAQQDEWRGQWIALLGNGLSSFRFAPELRLGRVVAVF